MGVEEVVESAGEDDAIAWVSMYQGPEEKEGEEEGVQGVEDFELVQRSRFAQERSLP